MNRMPRRLPGHAFRRTPMSAEHDEAGRTPWQRFASTPLGAFVRTETGSAALLVAAIAAALAWYAVDSASYEQFWTMPLSLQLDRASLSLDLRGWVNSGLMVFFFLVVGLEARRALDVGELRVPTRTVLPALAGLAGMAAGALTFVAVTAGTDATGGWGVA